ncbi:DUF2407 C-terminal domain-containing protein [Myxozyma melibiosi]|uniref:DUF2407 C-terminal domain-containing protein n=1 Tax=Myxozyma melibiosi TaxID=54550 RepID=A0ABR1F3C1_9ASCO
MSLGIRFSRTSIPDLILPLPAPSTALPVASVKRRIRTDRAADTSRRRLRLIYGGRALPDSDDLAKTIKPIAELQSGRSSAEYAAGAASGAGAQTDDADDERLRTIWLLCSVGDVLTDEELAQENDTGSQPLPSTLPAPVGFDRLRSAGFSDEDIAQLRAQFNRLHGGSLNTDPEAARQLEDRWIDEGASAPDTLPDGSPIGVYEDLLLGTVVGFFLGFVALFFLREGSIFSKRQQMAIIAGIIINVSFAILKVYY